MITRRYIALFFSLFLLISAGCSRNRNKSGVIYRASDDSLTSASASDSSSVISSGSASSADKRLDAIESKVDKASHNVGELVTAMFKYKETMENAQGFTKEYRQSIEGQEKKISELQTKIDELKQKIEKLDLSANQYASREKLAHMQEYITVINEKLARILNMESQDKLLENFSKSEANVEINKQKLEDLKVNFNRLRQKTEQIRQEAGQIRQETGLVGSQIGLFVSKVDQLSNQTQQLYELIKQGNLEREELKKGQHKLIAAQKKLRTTQKKINKKVNKKEDKAREISEKALYDSANRLHVNQAYTDSIVLFSRFVESFPKSKMADNAQYWVGVGYFSMKNYARAADEFKLVWQKNFPDNSSMLDALFKLGECFLKLNQRPEAVSAFRRVINEASGNQRYFLLVDGARKYLSEMGETP